MSAQTLAALVLLLVLVGVVVGAIQLGRTRRFSVDRTVVVRCRDGHLFSTIWVPGISFKAVRLGWVRLQRCPVGNHLRFVTPVRDSKLTDAQRRLAEQHRDSNVP